MDPTIAALAARKLLTITNQGVLTLIKPNSVHEDTQLRPPDYAASTNSSNSPPAEVQATKAFQTEYLTTPESNGNPLFLFPNVQIPHSYSGNVTLIIQKDSGRLTLFGSLLSIDATDDPILFSSAYYEISTNYSTLLTNFNNNAAYSLYMMEVLKVFYVTVDQPSYSGEIIIDEYKGLRNHGEAVVNIPSDPLPIVTTKKQPLSNSKFCIVLLTVNFGLLVLESILYMLR